MHKNQNRPGYQESKVGWIPKGWNLNQIGELGTVITGNTPSKKEPLNYGSNFCWATAEDFTDKYIRNTRLKLSEQGVKCAHLVPAGSVLVTCIASIGLNGIAKVPLATNQQINSIIVDPSCSNEFVYYLIQKNKNVFRLMAGAGALPILNKGHFEKIPLALPPLPEQKAIAAVLECWDKGIRNLELKIAKKRNVKKGLMQRLLSGKQRLKGFSEAWKTVMLGEVFEFKATFAFSRECLTTEAIDNSDIYNIHYGDIHATYTGPILDLAKERRVPMLKTSDALPDTLKFLQEGDLVMADVSEDYEGIGACIELKNLAKKKLTGGLHTFVMRDESGHTASGFRGYMFKEYRLAKELKRIATGVSVYSLSKTNLSEVELTLPPLAEQRAIAEVLCAGDGEIDALENKLALWKEQKKYLLNNLVTGTIRLPQFCLSKSAQKKKNNAVN